MLLEMHASFLKDLLRQLLYLTLRYPAEPAPVAVVIVVVVVVPEEAEEEVGVEVQHQDQVEQEEPEDELEDEAAVDAVEADEGPGVEADAEEARVGCGGADTGPHVDDWHGDGDRATGGGGHGGASRCRSENCERRKIWEKVRDVNNGVLMTRKKLHFSPLLLPYCQRI